MEKTRQADEQKTENEPIADKHHGVGHGGEESGDSTVVNDDHAGLGAGGEKSSADQPEIAKPLRK